MAVMSAFTLRAALPPRHTPAASAWRMPPRVYSPLPRRLSGPMAVAPTQSPERAYRPSGYTRRYGPRGRGDTSPIALSFLKR